MKSFMKGCAITALVLGALGVVLAMAGGSMAGRSKIAEVVESATGGRVRMNPFSWLEWGIDGGDWRFNAGDMVDLGAEDWLEEDNFIEGYEVVQDNDPMFSRGHDIITGSRQKYCPGDGIQELDIEIAGCDFWTQESQDGNIYLEVNNAHRFQAYIKEDTLHIKAKSEMVKEWTNGGSITLYLPAGYRFTDVDVELGAGSCIFNELNAAEVSMEVGAGEAGITMLDAAKLDVTLGAGQVWFSNIQVNELDAEIGMGAFFASGTVNGNVDVECSMGSVEMVIQGREQDFNYSLEDAMGTICLGDNNYGGLAEEREINNHASKEMDIECSMGNVTITFTDD